MSFTTSGPWHKPQIVKIPDIMDAQSEIRSSALRTQTPLRMHAELSFPHEFLALNADTEAFAQDKLLVLDQESQQLPGCQASHGGSLDDYVFFPFATRYCYVFLSIRRYTGTVAGMLDTPAPALRPRRVEGPSPAAKM